MAEGKASDPLEDTPHSKHRQRSEDNNDLKLDSKTTKTSVSKKGDHHYYSIFNSLCPGASTQQLSHTLDQRS